MSENENTTIMIRKTTKKEIGELGEYGDSMDDIINKLIKKARK